MLGDACQGWSGKASNKAVFEQRLKGVRKQPTWKWAGELSRERGQHLPRPQGRSRPCWPPWSTGSGFPFGLCSLYF